MTVSLDGRVGNSFCKSVGVVFGRVLKGARGCVFITLSPRGDGGDLS